MGSNSSSSSEKKLSWLQSQIIGDAEFESPFGKRKLTYADHTASARSLRYIEDYITNNVLPFYGNTHTCDSYVGQRMTKMVHEASNYIKRCLGGGEEDAIIFCGSGTTAAIKRLQEVMGITVPSILRDRVLRFLLRDEERWVVFVGPYEHHSNLLSWRQSLAEVVEIGLDANGLLNIEALKSQLEFYKNAHRPLLGSFSACSNVTGIYSDTRLIATLLHQYGGFACFDFAASGPYVEIDMRSGEMDGYDAIFLSTHKFIGGPGSPGILLMSKALYQLGSYPPSTCGGGTVNYVNGFNEKGYVGVKPGWTRISFTYYMPNEEFEFIIAALEFIADHGQRFLPLYQFNVKTGSWCFIKRPIYKDLIGKENNHNKNCDTKHLKKINQYASYLENANKISNLLPEFSCQSSLSGYSVLQDLVIFE